MNELILQAFVRLFAPWRRRILLMVGRAVLEATKNTKGRVVFDLQALSGEKLTDVEQFQQWGFASRPPKGTELILVSVGGERGHMIAIASGNRKHEPEKQDSETVMYDDKGQMVFIKEDGIKIVSPMKVEIETPECTVVAETTKIEATTATIEAATLNIVSQDMNMGGGTGDAAQVARVGDQVRVGSTIGEIISGSDQMRLK